MRLLVLCVCLLALPACTMQPPWLTATLASNRLGGIDPAIVDQAAGDADHIAHIRSAARAPDPKDPRAAQEAFNLSHLLYQLAHRNNYATAYLDLARHLYTLDPENHGYTLAGIAERRPFEECEAEVLRIAFDPRTDTQSVGWRRSRGAAATALVARLALEVRQLPRPLPAGAPEFTVADGRNITCNHWTLRAAYAQGDLAANIAKVSAILDNLESPYRPGDDHDVENCRTLIWRLTDLDGQQP